MSLSEEELKRYKLERIKLLEQKKALKEKLPHLYRYKFYKWAREFFDSRNRMNLLTAANQVGKSSVNIRKSIHWATETDLWSELWPSLMPGDVPSQFWYFYPTKTQATIEWRTKWSLFMPKVAKSDPLWIKYGWKEEKDEEGDIFAIHFNTGCSIYFKSYAQQSSALQTGTVYAIFLDEECPENKYDELMFRLSASNGYFHAVFTATLGQEMWRLAMEPAKDEEEKFPHAMKQTVSMYDCLFYEDGTKSHWTIDKIQNVIANCKDEREVAKRVFGKFIKGETSGLKVPHFNPSRHMVNPFPIPDSWSYYSAVDPGSGGKEAHPGAIMFLAVAPDYKRGAVIACWRGDDIRTTAGDLVNQHTKMKTELGIKPTQQVYDWADADFFQVATSLGEAFTKAEKSHEKGESLINVLFRNDLLVVFNGPEQSKLASELSRLRKDQNKRHALDDLYDTLRYAACAVPWDLTTIKQDESVFEKPAAVRAREMSQEEKEAEQRRLDIAARRGEMRDGREEVGEIEAELDGWNDLYG